MVEYKKEQLNLILHALADATRREILQRITEKPHNVSELAAPFAMSLNAISKHLKLLEQAGLAKRIKKGRFHYFVFNRQPLEEVVVLITHLQQQWEERLDALENYFKSSTKEKKK